MKYDPHRHHRRSIRLPGYDYTQPGAYFVTLVTHERECLFGVIMNGEMRLNDVGRVAEQCWRDIPVHFPHLELDVFVIMPNHIHGVLWIVDDDNNGGVGAKNFSPLPRIPHGTSKTIGSVVRGFKIGVTKWCRQNAFIDPIWQRNYYEHIIRNDGELERIRQYILNNPANWVQDEENPDKDAIGY